MSFVLDASVALNWCFEDERTPAADEALDRAAEFGAMVPSLWRLEVANGLQMALRRGRITKPYRDAVLQDFATLDIAADPGTGDRAWSDVLAVSDAHRLTVYDAAYLELALRLGVPLATFDRRMREAAASSYIELLFP